jgi:hypothetical protein
MTKRKPWLLIDEVAHMCEKAYRRGFQQGAICMYESEGGDDDLLMEILKWRFFKKDTVQGEFVEFGAYENSVAPPWRHPGFSESAVFRLQCELGHNSTPQLDRLLREYRQGKNRIKKSKRNAPWLEAGL